MTVIFLHGLNSSGHFRYQVHVMPSYKHSHNSTTIQQVAVVFNVWGVRQAATLWPVWGENSSKAPYICIRILLLDFYHAISRCCVSSCLIPCTATLLYPVICLMHCTGYVHELLISYYAKLWVGLISLIHEIVYTKLPYVQAWPSSSLRGLRSQGLCPTRQPSLTETLRVRTTPLGALICFLTKHLVWIEPVRESVWQNVPKQSMEIWIYCIHPARWKDCESRQRKNIGSVNKVEDVRDSLWNLNRGDNEDSSTRFLQSFWDSIEE